MKKTRIILVDDHQIVLKGMVSIVKETLGQKCAVDTASTAAAVLENLRESSYDLCIFDIGLPDADGLELLRYLRAEYPKMKVIVHTVHEQAWYMRAFLDADVEGVLFKSSDIYEISRALTTVLEGGRFYSHAARVLKNAMDCLTHVPQNGRWTYCACWPRVRLPKKYRRLSAFRQTPLKPTVAICWKSSTRAT